MTDVTGVTIVEVDEEIVRYSSLAEIRQRFIGVESVVIEIDPGPTPTVQEILAYVRLEAEKIAITELIDD